MNTKQHIDRLCLGDVRFWHLADIVLILSMSVLRGKSDIPDPRPAAAILQSE